MSIFTRRCNICGGAEETVTDGRGGIVYVRNTCTCHNTYSTIEKHKRWVLEDEASEAAGIPPADLEDEDWD